MLNLENFSLKETLKLNESIINFKIDSDSEISISFCIDKKYIINKDFSWVKFSAAPKDLNFIELKYKFEGYYTPFHKKSIIFLRILNDNLCLRDFIKTFGIDFLKINFNDLLETKKHCENIIKEYTLKKELIENSLKNMNLEFL